MADDLAPVTLGEDSDMATMVTCPRCGHSEMRVGRDLEGAAFSCDACGTRWRIELGYVHALREARDPPVVARNR